MLRYFVFILFILSSKEVTSQTEHNMLGNVVFSILEPSQFIEQNGEGWVLLNGAEITGSNLDLQYGISKIPNAQGQFIRIIDLNRSRDKRIDKGRKFQDQVIGSIEDYSTALPINSFTASTESDGSHTHIVSVAGRHNSNNNETQYLSRTSNAKIAHTNHDGTALSAGSGHSHIISTLEGGDKETRPTNIILYAYIKIN